MNKYTITNNTMFEIKEDGSLVEVGDLPKGCNIALGIMKLLPNIKAMTETIEIKEVKKAKPRKKKIKNAI